MEQEDSLVQRTAARGMIFNINSTSFHRDQCSGTDPRDHLPTCASQRSSTVATSHATRNTTNENSHEDVRTSQLFVLCMWLYWISHRGTLGNIPDFNCTAWRHVNRCLYRAARVPPTLQDFVIHTIESMVFQYSDSTINDCGLENSGHVIGGESIFCFCRPDLLPIESKRWKGKFSNRSQGNRSLLLTTCLYPL